jgi:hypothetical protein
MAYIERRSLEFPLIVVKQDDQVKSFSLSLNSRFIVFFFFKQAFALQIQPCASGVRLEHMIGNISDISLSLTTVSMLSLPRIPSFMTLEASGRDVRYCKIL